jgi:hypothetical protein
LPRDWIFHFGRDGRAFLQRVGNARRVVFILAVRVIIPSTLAPIVSLHVFARSRDSLVGVGLRRKWDEADVGDLVYGFTAYGSDMFTTGYRDEEERCRDFQES